MRGEPLASSDQSRHEPAREPLRGRTCAVWGVLNVTPDSFSDGGRHDTLDAAVAHAIAMAADGADVIDVGGESSRPPGKTYDAGFVRVEADEEIARVVPVIERLREELTVPISVDTIKGPVARAALEAGASIVNDVSGGASDELLEAVAGAGAELVLMHTRADGRVDPETARYADLVIDVRDELMARVERAVEHGVGHRKIWIDPGIGFAKDARQSAKLLGNLDVFVDTGYPVLVAASRKSFIAQAMVAAGVAAPPPLARLGGSLAAVAAAARARCAAVRVHDVFASRQAARVTEAMR